MASTKRKIDGSILLQANAELIDQIDLLSDVAISRWAIDRNSVAYEKDDSHTLSLYLKGGDTSYRADQRSNLGAPGRLCLMPQGHASQWHIGDKVDFAHLYFSDAFFKYYAVSHLDYDARLIELRDATYDDNSALRNMLTRYVFLCETARHCANMEAEQILMQIFNHLICHYSAIKLKPLPIKAGLSDYHRKAIRSAIDDQLHEKLTIDGLAKLTGHSPYHFARMFKLSFGVAPAQYINRQRIERVKTLLDSTASLASISAKLGFAHQSHMTTQFKNIIGITPGAYRARLTS